MGVYTHSSGNWLTRRGSFLIILIVFHLILAWALMSGFAVKLIKTITEPIKVEIVNEVKPEEPPPPPPEVKMELPPVQVPPVLVDIPNPPEPPPTVIIAETTTQPVPPAPPAPTAPVTRPVARTQAVVTRRPDPRDFYPSASLSQKEEATIKVRICIDATGKITEVTVSEASKFPRLNEAAVKYGNQMRFKPATEDGKPVQQCFGQPVKFAVNDMQ
jgi:periplasmic protein TonB